MEEKYTFTSLAFAFGIWMLFTSSASAQWKPIGRLPATPTAGFFWDRNSGLVACSPNWWNPVPSGMPALFKTTNGGQTWTAISMTIFPTYKGSITGIYMRDRLNGWLTIHVFDVPGDYSPGLYRTMDGGNTWTVVPNSVQWNNVFQTKEGTLFLSNGGIACASDSFCMISSAASAQPANNVKFNGDSFVSTDAGQNWTSVGHNRESWGGLYYQSTSHIFFDYGEGPVVGTPSPELWSTSDSGHTWNPGPSPPGIVKNVIMQSTTGDIEGSGEAFYIQSTFGPGMYRSTDRGASWKYVYGPSNRPDTRFCVLQTCKGGTVIAFDTGGGVWLTTNGGDGMLKEDDTSAVVISALPRIKACDASKALTTIFSNACPNGLRVDSIALVGDTIHFSLDSVAGLPITFGGGTSDSFYVRFTPLKQAGTFTTKLHVRGVNILPDTTLPFDTLIAITATAMPEPPSLLSELTQFNLDSASLCNGLRDTSVTFINTGCTSDTLTDVSTLGAGFSWLRDSLPIVIASGDSVRLRFRFVPPDSGGFSGTAKLTVVSMGLTQTPQLGFSGVGVHGTGILNVLSTSLQAGSFSFCAGDTTVFDTIRNTGCDTLLLSNGQLQGDPTFTLLTPLPTQLPPDSVAIISIHFSPRTKGPHTAQ
ncbi:MAG: hypothetical protein Q8902_14725, partial [Bacteroidota bacterium]|nr:hypothetical protein [Bacteroidota bacterium]